MHPLAIYRKEKGLTQQDLAERLGIHKVYLALIETYKKTPSTKLALKIEQLTGVGRLDVLYPKASGE